MNEKHYIRHYHNPIWYNQISVLQFLFKSLFLASVFMSCLFIIFYVKDVLFSLSAKDLNNAKDVSNKNFIDDIPFVPALQNQFSKSVISFGCHRKKTELGFLWLSLLLNIFFNNFEFLEYSLGIQDNYVTRFKVDQSIEISM